MVMALISCSRPKDYKIPTDIETWKNDESFKKAIQGLEASEKETAARFLARAALGTAFGAAIPEGLTVGEAIEKQKTWEAEQSAKEAEQKALAEKVAKERAEAEARMNAAVTYAVASIRIEEANMYAHKFRDSFLFDQAVENKSDREIAAVKGTVHFRDVFGDPVMSMGVGIDNAIPPGGRATWTGSLDFNQFMDDHKRLRATPLEKMKVVFEPLVIIFSDGSRMEAPQ